jgi:hypothetical protein
MTLQPLPGVDPIRSLRWVLKGLLQQHGMRCVNLREEKKETYENDDRTRITLGSEVAADEVIGMA